MRLGHSIRMWLLIDGYNVLFAAGILMESRPTQLLEPARRWLLNYLIARIPADQRDGIIVVFDAKRAPGDRPSIEQHAGITVLFAHDDEEADDLIEHLIRRASVPARVTVVSTDRRLREVARRRRAESLTSEAWLEAMDDRVARDEPKSPEPGPRLPPSRDAVLTPDEVDHWLTAFQIDPRSAATEPPPPRASESTSVPPALPKRLPRTQPSATPRKDNLPDISASEKAAYDDY